MTNFPPILFSFKVIKEGKEYSNLSDLAKLFNIHGTQEWEMLCGLGIESYKNMNICILQLFGEVGQNVPLRNFGLDTQCQKCIKYMNCASPLYNPVHAIVLLIRMFGCYTWEQHGRRAWRWPLVPEPNERGPRCHWASK